MTIEAEEKGQPTNDFIGENLKTILIALFIALLIRIFLFQPFNIPSGSMIPTLLVGDYLFVSKYEYGLSRHSFPFSPPLFRGRMFSSVPSRGDVAVFKLTKKNVKPSYNFNSYSGFQENCPDVAQEGFQNIDYIKRVIGVPGDTLAMRDGVLIINGQSVPRVRIDDFISENGQAIPQYRETLPSGVSFNTLDQRRSDADNFGPIKVQPGYYFMMGDNRDNSKDSRMDVCQVPLQNFIGKAEFIFFSTDGSAALWQIWKWPFATRWSRVFTQVK